MLVVGATGSGKSTTLVAMIGHRNRTSAGHIINVEDPVEYVHVSQKSLVTHREVGVDTHSWHHALKNTLRQAPDVILIGEIRDTETMEHAIERARTHGAAIVGLRNSYHIGRIGHWGEQCAAAGMASLHFVNVCGHAPLVAPYGGREARFVTNPICLARWHWSWAARAKACAA